MGCTLERSEWGGRLEFVVFDSGGAVYTLIFFILPLGAEWGVLWSILAQLLYS